MAQNICSYLRRSLEFRARQRHAFARTASASVAFLLLQDGWFNLLARRAGSPSRSAEETERNGEQALDVLNGMGDSPHAKHYTQGIFRPLYQLYVFVQICLFVCFYTNNNSCTFSYKLLLLCWSPLCPPNCMPCSSPTSSPQARSAACATASGLLSLSLPGGIFAANSFVFPIPSPPATNFKPFAPTCTPCLNSFWICAFSCSRFLCALASALAASPIA